MEEQAYYDEINLGKYIETLFRQWRLIFLIPFLCVIITGSISILKPKVYETSVLIASTRSGSEVSFGSEIRTLSEDSLLAAGNSIDSQSRLQSYARMVKNPSIAETIINLLGEKLLPAEKKVDVILNMVEGKVVEGSDAIQIKVSYRDPVLAAEIANLWGQSYITKVNQLYNNSGILQLVSNIEEQVTIAKTEYENAQEAYDSYLASSQQGTLEREIRHLQVSTLVLENARNETYSKKIEEKTSELSQHYDELLALKSLERNAEAMLNQLQLGGEGAVTSNGAALTLLKIQSFAYPKTGEDTIELQLSTNTQTVSLENALADLKGLVKVLQEQEENILQDIQNLENELLANSGPDSQESTLVNTIFDLEEKLNLAQSQLSEEKAKELKLKKAKTLAWETYVSVTTKLEELKIESQTASDAVLLAVPASAPENDTISVAQNIIVAFAIGLIAATISVYFIEFWWRYNSIEPEPITIISIFKKENSNPSSERNS